MLSNDLKKGDKIRLKNGWDAIIMDNLKGNIRLAEVFGFETEIGSIYVSDIAWVEKNGETEKINLTDRQAAAAKMRGALGF